MDRGTISVLGSVGRAHSSAEGCIAESDVDLSPVLFVVCRLPLVLLSVQVLLLTLRGVLE
jgi:hypothetical protein